jgi:PhnB protein
VSLQIQPYIWFDGRCEEALEFYKKAVGAKVDALMRNKESPEPPPPGMNAPADKIMHAAFRIGDTQVLASDGMCGGKPAFQGFSLALSARDDAEAKRFFGALGEGGQVRMPLTPTFFASSFGMLTDRFGIGWMVMAAKEPEGKTR